MNSLAEIVRSSWLYVANPKLMSVRLCKTSYRACRAIYALESGSSACISAKQSRLVQSVLHSWASNCACVQGGVQFIDPEVSRRMNTYGLVVVVRKRSLSSADA